MFKIFKKYFHRNKRPQLGADPVDLQEPKPCFVFLSKVDESDGTIYCGIKTPGMAIKENKDCYWVMADDQLQTVGKSAVQFTQDSD